MMNSATIVLAAAVSGAAMVTYPASSNGSGVSLVQLSKSFLSSETCCDEVVEPRFRINGSPAAVVSPTPTTPPQGPRSRARSTDEPRSRARSTEERKAFTDVTRPAESALTLEKPREANDHQLRSWITTSTSVVASAIIVGAALLFTVNYWYGLLFLPGGHFAMMGTGILMIYVLSAAVAIVFKQFYALTLAKAGADAGRHAKFWAMTLSSVLGSVLMVKSALLSTVKYWYGLLFLPGGHFIMLGAGMVMIYLLSSAASIVLKQFQALTADNVADAGRNLRFSIMICTSVVGSVIMVLSALLGTLNFLFPLLFLPAGSFAMRGIGILMIYLLTSAAGGLTQVSGGDIECESIE